MFDRWKVPVVRERDGATGEDIYGHPIPGETISTDLPPALFAPTPTSLLTQAGIDSTSTQPTVYWPREWPDVIAGDRLIIDGTTWEIDGRPASWPLGLVVILTDAEGVPRGTKPLPTEPEGD